jgi:hypothetical protein
MGRDVAAEPSLRSVKRNTEKETTKTRRAELNGGIKRDRKREIHSARARRRRGMLKEERKEGPNDENEDDETTKMETKRRRYDNGRLTDPPIRTNPHSLSIRSSMTQPL